MARIIILGSAAAVNDAQHDYTHILLIGDKGTPVLIDAGSNPLGKIKDLGVDDEDLRDVVLTHFHPDHVSGVPNMLMHMWLLGRQSPLRFYGLHHCINRVEDMMSSFGWQEFPNFYNTTFHRISERDEARVLENDEFLITSWTVKHFVPTIGLRIVNKISGKVMAYSCDTEPTPNLYKLAQGADLLIHEAAGPPPGHSTALQAGQVATAVGAKSLYLIHYQVWNTDPTPLVGEAAQAYDGDIILCKDFDEFEF
ncbi:MAG: MBL fold metallo-hydrolase [Anaerolineae bacterium]|jgi:ribonuclease Z|nr:MBL fold metallo-hydrolase [Anaerolineae bacterium]